MTEKHINTYTQNSVTLTQGRSFLGLSPAGEKPFLTMVFPWYSLNLKKNCESYHIHRSEKNAYLYI